MVKEQQKTEEEQFSKGMLWVTLGGLALPLVILVAVLLAVDWPFGEDAGDGHTWFVIAAVIVLVSFEKIWPKLKSFALDMGTPPWVFDEGWRSAALLSALLATIMVTVSAWTNNDSWFSAPGTVLAFVGAFLFWFTWFFVIPTLWQRWRNAR